MGNPSLVLCSHSYICFTSTFDTTEFSFFISGSITVVYCNSEFEIDSLLHTKLVENFSVNIRWKMRLHDATVSSFPCSFLLELYRLRHCTSVSIIEHISSVIRRRNI